MKQGKDKQAAKLNSSARSARGAEKYVAQLERQRTELAEAVRDLYQLLEEYGPAWYTKEHHERAVSALRLVEDVKSMSSNNGLPHQYRPAHRS